MNKKEFDNLNACDNIRFMNNGVYICINRTEMGNTIIHELWEKLK